MQPLLVELKAGVAKKRVDAVRDHAKQILTNTERRQLAEWILASADGQDPKDRTTSSRSLGFRRSIPAFTVGARAIDYTWSQQLSSAFFFWKMLKVWVE